MAFMNSDGEKVSFECSELMKELKSDISEFGGDMIVGVVTQSRQGVVLYKDYNFMAEDKASEFPLKDGERVIHMTASALLVIYENQNSIL